MSDKEEKELWNAWVPANAISNSYILGIHFTHWIEAAVFIGITDFIVWNVGFVERVKWIVTIVLTIALLYVFLKGIKGRTLTEAIFNGIRGLRNRKEYHLGDISNDRKAADMAQYSGQSGIEQIGTFIRQKGKALDKRYGKEPDEE